MAITKGKQIRTLVQGRDDSGPGKANDIVYAGGVVMLDASGRAINGVAATGCIGVGIALTNRDLDRYDSTGLADAALTVRWEEGIALLKNSGSQPFLSSDQPGILAYIEDNETASKTDQSTTLSVMGLFHHLDADGVWVTMGKTVGALGKDMVTVTDASAAHLAGSETFTGVKTFASSADPVFAKEADHTTNVVATTTAATAGGALTVAAGKSGTSGTGGAINVKGGAGDTTGAGGAATIVGGAGGSSSGTGGAAAVKGGAGSAGNANGGAVTIDGGAKNGTGSDGLITIGGTNGLGIALNKPVGLGSAQALSGAGAVNVTSTVTKFTSTGASQALTLADGTFAGQIKIVHHTVDGGSGILTPTTAGNFATFTFTNVHDACLLYWTGTAWDILLNVGGTVG